ncbi:MAG: catalase [Propionibacteriales bacterium]|nr:catalase [Propionibacteriales bacterium]
MVTPAEAIDRIQAAFGAHGGARSLHAKGRFYSGTFTATPAAAERGSAAFLQGGPVPVLVRWSNGGGDVTAPDKAPDVRGMAVSFRHPDGATDLLGQTAPRFPVRSPDAFVRMVEAARRPSALPGFLLRHPSALPALAVNAKAGALVPPRSFAAATFFPIHAYSWTAPDGVERWVRYVLRPLDEESGRPSGTYDGADRLFDEMEARLAAGPVRHTLEVTVASDGDDPHDPMSVWRGVETFDAGTIEVTATAPDPETDGKVTVFDPTRIVEGIGLSDDPILLFRPGAYSESVNRRM